MCYVSRFLQYYREHAKYSERSFKFIERIGMDVLKSILVEDDLGICQQLEARMEETLRAYKDPWNDTGLTPVYANQFITKVAVGGML